MISVAMCTYNGAAYLEEQLESIEQQSVLPLELVVCDDGSTDDTIEILNSFASRASFRVRVHRNRQNLGSTKNFEQAITLCKGAIIALADQDDAWRPDKLQHICAAFQADPGVGLVFSDGNVVDPQRRLLGYTLWDSFRFSARERRKLERSDAFEVLLGHSIITGAAMAFRARFCELFLPIPREWVHDGWIAQLISTRAGIKPIPEALIDYRKHAEQQIGDGHRKGILEKLRELGGNEDCQMYLQQSELLREKLLQLAGGGTERLLQAVDDRILHLRARIRTRQIMRLKRLPLMVRELVLLRYHIYSNGVLSFAKDIIR